MATNTRSHEEYDAERVRLQEWARKQTTKDTPVTWAELERDAGVSSRSAADRMRIMRTLKSVSELWVAVRGVGVKLLGGLDGDVADAIQRRSRTGVSYLDGASRISSAARVKLGSALRGYDRLMADAADQWRSIRKMVTPLLKARDKDEASQGDDSGDQSVQSEPQLHGGNSSASKGAPRRV